MSSTAALDSSQIGKIGIGAIVALVVVGVLLSLAITAVVGRLVIVAAVVVLGAVVWQQRTTIQDHVNKCELSMSFFGVAVHAPRQVVDECRARQLPK
jgi:hypothetical protein